MREGGFTLIEIVIVVFLIVVVTAAVLPSFSARLSRDISSDAKSAASIIRYLSDNAANTKNEEVLAINLDKKTLGYTMNGKERTTELESFFMVDFTPAGTKYSGEMKITFPPTGLPSRLKVRLKDKSLCLDVIYNPYSGRVTIEEVAEPEEKNGTVQVP